MARPDAASALARPALAEADAAAVKALARGAAEPHQQLRAFEYILHALAATDGLSFRPDGAGGERETSFAEGRRFVGLQLRRIVLLPLEELVPVKGSPDVPR